MEQFKLLMLVLGACLAAAPRVASLPQQVNIVCELMSGGLAGIFGPSSASTAPQVQAVCDTMEVPHIQTLFNPYLNRETCSINLHPHHTTFAEILVRLVDVYEWKDFTILYEDDDSLVRVTRLLEKYDPRGPTVTVRQLTPDDMKPVFRKLLHDNVKNIIIDCNINTLRDALAQAQQIGVMGKNFNYIITNLDFHTLDLEPYRYSGTNMTGLRIVRPDSPLVKSAVEAWASAAAMAGDTSDLEPENLRMGPALMWDAVHLFARALERLDQSRMVELPALECDDKKDQPGERGQASWDHGFSLLNFMRTTEIEGLTGTLRFDNQGIRTDYSLDIVELSPDMESTVTIGNVDLNTFNLSRIERAKDDLRRELESVRNKTFVVQIALSEPYNMLQDSAAKLTGNDRYEGFCIDLIKELALQLGFNYTFVQQPDNAYGSCNAVTERCTGMLGKVQDGATEDPTFKQLFANLEKDEDNEQGLQRVIKSEGEYAFFMESSSIEYQAQRQCEVRKKRHHPSSVYAPYRSALSAGVVKLQESGKLSELRTRWWEQRRGGGKCSGAPEADSSDELGLDNVGGVFLVLGVGVSLAVLLAFAELLWDLAAKRHSGEVASFRAELLEELKFILKCSGSTKPVKKSAKSDEEQIEDALKEFQPLSPYAVLAYHQPVVRRSHFNACSQILVRLTDAYEWKDYTILYEDDDSLVRVTRLLEKYDPRGPTVTVRQLPLEDMKELLHDNVKNIIIDCGINTLKDALAQAQQIGVMGKNFNYIITNLDFHTLDLEPYRYSGTNMTGLRIVRPDSPLVKSAVEAWASAAAMAGDTSDLEPENLKMGPALMWDAVHLFARALERLDQSRMVELPALECDDKKDQPGERGLASWDHGFSLLNFMRTTEIEGLTGTLRFDNQGFRTDYLLDIVELSPAGESTVTIGNVDLNTFNLTRIERAKEDQRRVLETVRNMTFRVQIAISEPYNMLQETATILTGNDRYEGFCIDLIKELALNLGFNYTFIHQPGMSFGECDNITERCTGMLGQVQKGEADLAITDLTITANRALGVDFTAPFMNLGIGLLHTVPKQMQPSLFSFLDPFSSEVWVYLLAAYVVVSVEMYIMARITPAEWTNPYPCIEEPEELENQFSMLNAFWFTIGAIMQQGSEIAPIQPGRLPYCVVSIAPQGSEDPIFKQLYANMEKVSDNLPGVKRVMDSGGAFAFFMESSSIEYQAQRECEVRQVGQNIDEKGYGIAMRKNAPYRSALSAGVVKLQESGKLSELRTRWWEQRRGGGKCSGAANKDSGQPELGMENMGGVFLVLGVGVSLAMLLAFAELVWDLTAKRHSGEVASFRAELLEELKFIFQWSGSTKPVKKSVKSEDKKVEDEQIKKDFQPLPYTDSEAGPIQNHKEPLF
ncbi:hypothetical protein FOCC_FOCC011231 [Frankliniella occidentalis]|nr:hypothetical protein FOCC_FOCC011231 [Frankliniella occidentalis]